MSQNTVQGNVVSVSGKQVTISVVIDGQEVVIQANLPTAPAKPPQAGSICAQVWDLCYAKLEELGRRPTSSEIVEAAYKAGLNVATANTQYGKWVKHMKAQAAE